MNVKEIKSNQIVGPTLDDLIVCDSSNEITLQLSSATGSRGICYVKNIGSADVTITCSDGATIDGATTKTVSQYSYIKLLDYKTNVWINISFY